jgi:uncharacterized membrane protein YeiB
MNSKRSRPTAASSETSPARYDVLDLVRGLAILGMLGSHLVGTEGGTTALERGATGLFAAIEPTVAAMFCVLAGVSWSIQAERVGVTPHFRQYFVRRALALGTIGLLFHILLWTTEILVPFALMMALSLVVLGGGPRASALALVVFVAVTPLVEHIVAPYAATDWFENGLHAADGAVGWVTLRYLFVDGNYPLISWMAFPLMGMLFWQTARSDRRTLAWFVGSFAVAVAAYAIAAYTSLADSAEHVARWNARGWTPTSALFLFTAGGGSLVIISALRWWWGTAAMPRVVQPLVLFGRASLSHYVLHIAIAYSILRLWYPEEDWLPTTGLRVLLAYLAIGIPATMFWFQLHTHGPLEALLARSSRRPGPRPGIDGGREKRSVAIIWDAGFASLHAVRSFAPGEVVFLLEGRPVNKATRYTIQVGAEAHLEPISKRASPWAYLNHGCDPNVTIDVPNRAIVARWPIRAGDQLRFDYNTTEWELAEPFVCNCGSPRCVGVVVGFAHLSPARREFLLGNAAPHIRGLQAARLRDVERQLQPAVRSGVRGEWTDVTKRGAMRVAEKVRGGWA